MLRFDCKCRVKFRHHVASKVHPGEVYQIHTCIGVGIIASMDAGYWVDEVPYQIYDNEFGFNAPKASRASHLRGVSPRSRMPPIGLSGKLCSESCDTFPWLRIGPSSFRRL